MKSKYFLLLLSIYFFCGGFQCPVECEEEPDLLRITFPTSIPMDVREIKIGDTLEIAATFEAQITEPPSTQFYDLSGGLAQLYLQLYHLEEGERFVNGGLDLFEYIVEQGDFEQTEWPSTEDFFAYLKFHCIDSCRFQMKMVAQEEGIYALNLRGGDFLSFAAQTKQLSTNISFDCLDNNRFQGRIIKTDNFNRDILETSVGIFIERLVGPGATVEQAGDFEFPSDTYFFKVVE